MRKAKVAAIIFGGVSTCIFGGLLGVYSTAPIVSSVAPKNDVENIYEVESENLANVAAVTSIRSTAVTTTSTKSTTAISFSTTAAVTCDTVETQADTIISSADFTMAKPVIAQNRPEPAATAVPTEPATEAPTVYAEPVAEPPTQATVPVEEPTDPPATEPVTIPSEPATEPETDAPVYDEPDTDSELPISDEEFIILCNAVAHEAGCSWIGEYDKAKVVEVIMNRVNSPLYPNTIEGVLTAPYQFSGASAYVYLGNYTGYVTESVKNAVTLYFTEPESFDHGYFGFYGDGYRNYFY